MVDVPPAYRLEEAADAAAVAVRLLQEAQEVRWSSALAERFRAELYGAIQDVRAVADRIDRADDAWSRLRARAWAQIP